MAGLQWRSPNPSGNQLGERDLKLTTLVFGHPVLQMLRRIQALGHGQLAALFRFVR